MVILLLSSASLCFCLWFHYKRKGKVANGLNLFSIIVFAVFIVVVVVVAAAAAAADTPITEVY